MINRVVEIWRDIPTYEGIYQVSNLGNVRSLPRFDEDKNGKIYQRKGVIMTPTKTTTGYLKVELVKDGIRKSKKIHRLVASAFLINTFNKPYINHKDGNPLNNVVDNLEWCTQEENMKHARHTGLTFYTQDSINHEELIKDYLCNSINFVCDKYDISKTVVYDILKKHDIKRHGNVKYSVNLDNLLSDMKIGMSNSDLATKYECSKRLIAVRRNKFKKGGLL